MIIYKQSSKVRKFSPTPIVRITDNGEEEIVFISTLPKKEGDVLSLKIIDLLNNFKT